MQLSYFQILALALFHGAITVHAMPAGNNVSVGLNAPESKQAVTKIRPLASSQTGKPNPDLQWKRGLPGGLPVNIMQNSDEARPAVPVDNYKTDMARLMGGQE